MEQRLFQDLIESDVVAHKTKQSLTLPISLAIHAILLVLAIVVPLVMAEQLPEPTAAVRAFFVEPPSAPYPHKIRGEKIPLLARLFAVVDVWDALSSDRPYRKRLPHEEVVEYLQKEAGRLFDPEIVKNFLPLIEEK